MAKSVASSLVCSCLDYANSLLCGITQKNVNHLQHVQNTLARVVASHALPCGTRSSDILQDLHWLQIDQRIEFKLATLTYNILHSSQPAYLRSLLNYHSHTFSAFCQHQSSVGSTCPHNLCLSRFQHCSPPQSETHSFLAFTFLPLCTLSAASLKLTVSSRPTAPPSGSAKCLRFGHWLTLCTLNMHLLTYLLT